MIHQEQEKNLSRVSQTCKFSAVVAKFNACKLTSYDVACHRLIRRCSNEENVYSRCKYTYAVSYSYTILAREVFTSVNKHERV